MNKPSPSTQPISFSIEDVTYAFFRHKWKLAACTTLGLAAAAGYYFTSNEPYTSEAKLMIRYVQEGKGPISIGELEQTKSPDSRGGESIMAAEAEIIKSLDLAQQVADIVGPEKILAQYGGGNNRQTAANLVLGGLDVVFPRRGNVLTFDFSHKDATVVQPVLTAVLDTYLKRHLEFHRPAGSFDDFLTQQTDQMRARLAQTEEELRKARAKAGIISLDETRKAQSDQINRLRNAILQAEAELAERNATVQELLRLVGGSQPKPAVKTEGTEVPDVALPLEDYRSIVKLLDTLRSRESELLMQFTAENIRVKSVRSQIVEAESAKSKLEAAHPQLLTRQNVVASSSTNTNTGPTFDFNGEYGKIAALETRIKILNTQLTQVRAEASALDEMESNIQELERRRSLEEANYRSFSKNLESARVDEALGTGRVTNISRIQNPTPPFKSTTKTKKITAGIAASGLVLGLAWVALIELLWDRSVRKVSQLEKQLGIDLFVSIPASGNAKAHAELRLLGSGSSASKDGGAALAPWNPSNALHPYYSTLRDRMIGFFENRNLNHKPRLVALTGMGSDRGAAEIAAGLAGCLSETGEGNVLFVDMTTNQGAAQQFYKGETVRDLDEVINEKERSNQARVADNLYVVGTGTADDKLPRILPKRFSHLIPKLRASDFDYIIFNMPPVNNTSPTPRLAGFMDVVLMVVESEKTQMESVEKAKALLSNSRAHVAAVLNNTKSYTPGSKDAS